MPVHIFIAILFLVATYKWGDFKNWKIYYNSILFLIAGDLMYHFLFSNKQLWVWNSGFLSDTVIELLWITILFPCMILLYFPYYIKKQKLKSKISYIFIWIIGFSGLEWIIYCVNGIQYKNGWNFFSSVIFYSLMFPLLIIHHIKPLLAIFLSSIWVIITLVIFQVPVNI